MSLFKINGFAARALAEQGRISVPHPDHSFIVAIKYALPQSVWVLIGIVILAAVISTTDRLMLTIGNCMGWGLYKQYFRVNATDAQTNMVNRIAVSIATAIAVILAIRQLELLVFLIWISIGIMFSTFTIPLMGGLYWKRATRQAGIASMILGLVSAILFASIDRYVAALPVHFSFMSFLVSGLSFVVISYLTPAPAKDVLENTETGFNILGGEDFSTCQ
jgi:SSS family solute:Na+ symporter